MAKAKLHVFVYSGDPDQMPHSAASDLGLHSLQITLLWGLQIKMGKNQTKKKNSSK